MISTLLLTFVVFALIMLGMALGVIFMGKRIKGSCGGLNGIAGADKCLVCHKEIDPDSPLHERIQCPRAARSQ